MSMGCLIVDRDSNRMMLLAICFVRPRLMSMHLSRLLTDAGSLPVL